MPEVEKRDILVGVAALTLVGLGIVLALKKPAMTKSPGDPVSAKIGFEHRGDAQNIWVGIGFAPAQTIGYGDIQGFKYERVSVEADQEYQAYSVEVKTVVPSLPQGKVDIFVFIQKEGGGLDPGGKGFLDAKWFDDILTIA